MNKSLDKKIHKKQQNLMFLSLGAIFILRKDIGVGGPENGNFPLLYVVKMSLRRWVGGWFKKASKHPYIL